MPSPRWWRTFPAFRRASRDRNSSRTCGSRPSRFGAEIRAGHVVSVDLSQKKVDWPQEAHRGQPGPRDVADPHPDHRQRRLGALAGTAQRAGPHRTRRFVVRHLRRLLLLRQGDCRHRRRRFGHGRSAVPYSLRDQGHADSPARRISASKIMLDRARKHDKIDFLTDTVVDDVFDVNKKEVTGLRLRNLKTGEQWDLPSQRHVSGHRAYAQCAIRGRPARARRRRISCSRGTMCARARRVYSSAATWPTGIIARRLLPPAPAAWRRWKRRNIWKRLANRDRARDAE